MLYSDRHQRSYLSRNTVRGGTGGFWFDSQGRVKTNTLNMVVMYSLRLIRRCQVKVNGRRSEIRGSSGHNQKHKPTNSRRGEIGELKQANKQSLALPHSFTDRCTNPFTSVVALMRHRK